MLALTRKSVMSLTVVAMVVSLASCKNQQSPVDFKVTVPDADHVEFSARLKQKYGLGIAGEFEIRDLGTISLIPESNIKGFGVAFKLNSGAFIRERFGVEYSEVSTLPTGQPFPEFMAGPVMDVTIPKYDSGEVKWHFYFGVRGEKYVGAAAVLRAVGANVPSVNIGYVFYDKQGRVVLGIQFFGPKLDGQGGVIENGGILVGTNLSPLIDTGSSVESLGAQGIAAVSQAISGKPISIGGRTVTTHVTVSGSQAHKIKSKRSFNKVMKRFIEATH